VDTFKTYFEAYRFPVGYVEAKGFMFPVETHFLEDVLEVRRVAARRRVHRFFGVAIVGSRGAMRCSGTPQCDVV
jgi:hypothetical protein